MNFLSTLLQNASAAIWLAIDNTGNAATTVTNAAADGTQTATPPAGGGFMDILPQIVIWGGLFVAMYFFLIRPQRKRDKAQREMQQALRVGDKVLTTAGFYGKIVDVGSDAFIIEFGDNRGVRVPVRKSDVLGIKTPDMSPPNREITDEDEKKKDKKEEKDKEKAKE
ncbi:MAG: preprotein translocase subunit YajC [Clostridiales bacterium]|jgi:preprotein translocase subunit YajC|nr:preprotein translocase subunit YajC [Clostridiales bacterium]